MRKWEKLLIENIHQNSESNATFSDREELHGSHLAFSSHNHPYIVIIFTFFCHYSSRNCNHEFLPTQVLQMFAIYVIHFL